MDVGAVIVKIFISFLIISVTEILIVVIRSRNAELIGGDLSLYGYGAVVGMVTRMSTGQDILPSYTWTLPTASFVIFFAFIMSMLLYAINTRYYAEKIRRSDKEFEYGINSIPHFWKSIKHPQTKKSWMMSFALGIMPAVFMANMIVFFG